MFVFFQLFIFLLGISFILIKFKKENQFKKIFILGCLIISALIGNIFLEFIPYPSETVVLQALNQKNDNSSMKEVVLYGYVWQGNSINLTPKMMENVDGKWMYRNNGSWMWRDPSEIRQAGGLTSEITLSIPIGTDREIWFGTDRWSGLVNVVTNTEEQVVDLYSEKSGTFFLSIEDSPSISLTWNKAIRLLSWVVFTASLFALFSFLYTEYRNHSKSFTAVSILLMLLFQSMTMIYWGDKKEGYHEDGIYTMELANGFDSAIATWNPDYLNQWHDREFFLNGMSPNEDTKFNYIGVYNNQVADVHPPLYYFIYHTVSSFFPNIISKWIGISINLFFFLLSSMLLFQISKFFIKDRFLQLLPNLLWGSSLAAISMVMFNRMYMQLTFCTLFMVYVYIDYIYQKSPEKKVYILASLTVYLGCMTQYYFMIFAFFFTAVACFYELIQKKYGAMLKYGISNAIGVGLMFCTFPAALNHIFFEYRGTEAISNADSGEKFSDNLKVFYSLTIEQLFGGLIGKTVLNLLLYGTLLFVFFYFICNIRVLVKENITISFSWFPEKQVVFSLHGTLFVCFLISLSSLAYFFIISLIAPFQQMRYIFIVQPLFSLCFIVLLKASLDKVLVFLPLQNLGKTLLSSLVISILMATFISGTPDFLYESHQKLEQVSADNQTYPTVYIKNDMSWRFPPSLLQFNDILCIHKSDINNLSVLLQKNDTIEQHLIVYFQYVSEDEIKTLISTVLEDTDFETSEYLVSSDGYTMYRLTK